MRHDLRVTLYNSTVAFIAAFFITTLIHESGHFVAYLLFGVNAVLHHNYVFTPDQPIELHVRIVSSLAGPVISLVQGFVFWIIVRNSRKNDSFQLLFLWLSLLGFVNFFGYLVMTPFFTGGDTGKVAELIEMAYCYRFLIAILGLLILVLIVLRAGRFFNRFIPGGLDMKGRKNYVYSLMFLPILIGSVVNTVFAFPVPAFLSIIYPATSSLVIMSSFGAISRAGDAGFEPSDVTKKINVPLIIILLAMALINRLLVLGLG